MRLYRIKRKKDGLYLNVSVPRFDVDCTWSDRYWTPSGIFWKRIDTVARKIRDLCSDWKTGCKMSPYNATGLYQETRIGYHPEKAIEYIVEFMDVTVDSTETMEAYEVIK